MATAVCAQVATDKALPPAAPTFRTHTDTGTDSHFPSSSWAGRGRRSLVQHTHHTLQVHKHTHIRGSSEHQHSPSAHPAPLPGSQPPLLTPRVTDLPAGPSGCSLHTHSTHTLVSQAPHTRGSPRISAWTLQPPDSPAWTRGLLLAGWSSLEFASNSTHTPHAHPVWGRYRHSPPSAGTRHMGCDLWSRSSLCC